MSGSVKFGAEPPPTPPLSSRTRAPATPESPIARRTKMAPDRTTAVRRWSAPLARLTNRLYSVAGIYCIRRSKDSTAAPESLLSWPTTGPSMGLRGLVIVILLVAAVALIPAPARGVNPTISNVTWTPWVPAHGENVVIEADVVSPGGTPTVTA